MRRGPGSCFPEALLASTQRIDGLEQVKTVLRQRERTLRPPVTIQVPLGDGARLASLYRMGEVLEQTVVGEHHLVSVRLAPWQAEQLRREGLHVAGERPVERKVAG